MDVLGDLDRTRAAINVLEHPFYQRWNRGLLHDGELGVYAGEYRQAVQALASASAQAAHKADPGHASALARHAEEEAEHVALWERFASSAGALPPDAGTPALAETRECARTWSAGQVLLEHLAVLYAIEASQPELSRTKLEGLLDHYGYDAEDPALEYFRLHELRDHEHAAHSRELIGQLLGEVRGQRRTAARMLARAREALMGNWRLLDGVERQACGAKAYA